jgi:hypothetical protein
VPAMADIDAYMGRRPYDLNRAWVEARSGWADGAGGVRRGGGGGGGGSLCAHARTLGISMRRRLPDQRRLVPRARSESLRAYPREKNARRAVTCTCPSLQTPLRDPSG